MNIMSARIVGVAVILALALLPPGAGAAEPEKFAIASAEASLSSAQAGAHADMTIAFEFTDEDGQPYALARDIEVRLPPGMIGNPQALPRCTPLQMGTGLEEVDCPQDAQVGITEVTLGGETPETFREPVYNMTSPGGDVVARLGFFAKIFPVFINVRIDPVDYSLIASIEGAPAAAALSAASTTLWGVPASPSHDSERITPAESEKHESPPGGRPATLPEVPFLSNPTSCGFERFVSVRANSYALPQQFSVKTAPFPQIVGCEKLSFKPKLSVIPTNPQASSPTGLDATLEIPQDEAAGSRATSTMKSAMVTLPEGLAINPAAGDGLEACSAGQVGFETTAPSKCPDASKLGSAIIDVPALAHPLEGSVYQRTPEPGNIFRFWLVADELGVHLKLPAEIIADEKTGQLKTVFKGTDALGGLPQVPVRSFALHIFGGPRAPLSTPAACGTYQTHYEFSPWSGNPDVVGETPMQITGGCGKGGFAPQLFAGTTNSAGGAFSTFVLELTREDGEGNPEQLDVTLPQGLLAKIADVPLCPEASAGDGSCPDASRVGDVAAAAGVGSNPLWIPQPGKAPTAIYLAGPYRSAPYSLVVRVPAQAGPFDLGTVVTRAGIYVDPESAKATIKSDPLPQILEGVPVSYRILHVETDRPNFTVNPTGCEEKQVIADLRSASGQTATATAGFQATNCARLDFAPKLRLSLRGGTKRSQNPALKAVLTQKSGQANIGRTAVTLPPSLFIAQAHINNPCTRVQFNADRCPKGSILGTATATTPLLDEPLKGKVYFRSNGGDRTLPDVVADLRGPFRIILVGFVDSVVKKGSEISRTRTTFANVPDAPVTKFTLSLFGGERGLLENSTNLCAAPQRALLQMQGQNGKSLNRNAKLATSCAKSHSTKKPQH